MVMNLTAVCWDRRVADVVVAGAGPAGWAAADQCARHGLQTVLVAPRPQARWPATYGLWTDECALLPEGSRWLEAPTTRVVAVTERRLARGYAVLDNDTVRTALAASEVRQVADRVMSASYGPRGCSVRLASGRVLAAATVIDATGASRVLCGGPARAPRAEQTAFGIVLPRPSAGTLAEEGTALFMDWRPPPGFAGHWPTFLYTVPLPGGHVLLEETSLARRPGLGTPELRDRLAARLAAHGVDLTGGVREHVRIPVDLPVPRPGTGAIPFGAAAAMVHPATGYGIAETFRLAPRVAEAISTGLPSGPAAAGRAARHAVWPPAARAVHQLRRAGLRMLLNLPPAHVPKLFELFFSLPAELQRTYLSGREDLHGTAAAMAVLFRSADLSVRGAVVGGLFRRV
jgi:lycopene beta-cyclase